MSELLSYGFLHCLPEIPFLFCSVIPQLFYMLMPFSDLQAWTFLPAPAPAIVFLLHYFAIFAFLTASFLQLHVLAVHFLSSLLPLFSPAALSQYASDRCTHALPYPLRPRSCAAVLSLFPYAVLFQIQPLLPGFPQQTPSYVFLLELYRQGFLSVFPDVKPQVRAVHGSQPHTEV